MCIGLWSTDEIISGAELMALSTVGVWNVTNKHVGFSWRRWFLLYGLSKSQRARLPSEVRPVLDLGRTHDIIRN